MNEVLVFLHSLANCAVEKALLCNIPGLIQAGVFYALGTVTLLGALGVVFFQNVVHSALSLTASFIGIGCIYFSISADFMGAVQLLVYGGAVAILIVMAIMLTRREDMAHSNPSAGLLGKMGAFIVAGMFCVVMMGAVMLSSFKDAQVELGDSVTGIADLMLTRYLLPFETAGVLLLIAMIGAIILAKGANES